MPGDIRYFDDLSRAMHEALHEGRDGRPPAPPQPPDNAPMDARVEKLEQFAGETRERLARVETKIDHIATDVNQFKWWALGSAVAIVLAVIGTGFSVQQMTVTTFQAAGDQAAKAAGAVKPDPVQLPPIIINVPASPAQAPAAAASGAPAQK